MKNPLEVLIEIKKKIDGTKEQDSCVINESLALKHDALLTEIYGIIEETIEDIKKALK